MIMNGMMKNNIEWKIKIINNKLPKLSYYNDRRIIIEFIPLTDELRYRGEFLIKNEWNVFVEYNYTKTFEDDITIVCDKLFKMIERYRSIADIIDSIKSIEYSD